VKRHLVAVAALLVVALGAPSRAQEAKPPAAPGGLSTGTVKVQLVLSRYQGDKKVISLPYTMTVVTDERARNTGRASLRVGTQVPITTMARQGGDEKAALVPTIQYRDVGTSIDCVVTALEDGRFKLDVTVEDSSVETGPGSGQVGSNPSFRSFRTNAQMVLRDGQTAQHTAATDRVSADVWKVDVTLNAMK